MQDPNYSNQREPDYPVGGPIGSPTGGPIGAPSRMSLQEERTWSMLAHLSILLWLITGPIAFLLSLTVIFLPLALLLAMPIAPFVVWMIYRNRSQKVAFHALQSLWYQVAWIGISIVYGIIAFVLTLITFGLAAFVLVPVGLVLGLVPFVHQCYAAYRVSQGEDYRYPIVADMMERT